MTKAHESLRRVVAALFTAALAALSMPIGVAHADAVPLSGYSCAEPLPADAPTLGIDYQSANGLLSLPQPSIADLTKVRADGKYRAGTEQHLHARWKKYNDDIESGARKVANPLGWDQWRRKYVQVFNNRAYGAKFEEIVGERFGLAGAGWSHNTRLPAGAFPAGTARPNRRVDFHNLAPGVRQIYELKSGADLDKAQLADLLKAARATGSTLIFVFGKPPSKAALDALRQAAAEQTDPAQRNDLLQARCVNAVGRPDVADPNAPMNPGGSIPVDGALGDGIDDSPDDAAQAGELTYVGKELGNELDAAREAAEAAVEAGKPAPAPESAPVSDTGSVPEVLPAPESPATPTQPTRPSPGRPSVDAGGIDFTSLQLRYVADIDVAGPGVQYAFGANGSPNGTQAYGGQRAARMASDAFFTWLALDPNLFWVNLRPDEPDRVIDATFGSTEAGRVLLEADLEMKNWAAKLQEQTTDVGRRYVDSLEGTKCVLGRRHWIEPLPASVHEEEGQLYILDTPLTVMLGKDNGYDITPGTDPCTDQTPEVTQRNQQKYEDIIMPALIDKVNHGSEFADLRRVYASRVAAEWFRKRNVTKPTAYAKVIGSNDIAKYTIAWDPRDVYNRYLTSLRDGVASFSFPVPEGTLTRRWGGVDFSKVEFKDVGAADFNAKWPTAAAMSRLSLSGPQVALASGDRGAETFLGGASSTQPLGGVWNGDPATFVAPPKPVQLVTAATSNPVFYVVVALPVLAWITVAGVMWRRRQRAPGH